MDDKKMANAALAAASLDYDAAHERRSEARRTLAYAHACADRHPDDVRLAVVMTAEHADEVAVDLLIVADLRLRAARLAVRAAAHPTDTFLARFAQEAAEDAGMTAQFAGLQNSPKEATR